MLRRGAAGRQVEAAVALVMALLCAATMYGSYVARGGRYLDDWWLGAYVRFPGALGFDSAHAYLSFYSGARPGAVAYWLLTYEAFGFHDGWHRAASVALAGLLAAVSYLLVRELGMGRTDGAAIAVLTLVLPVADAIHFWMTPAVGQLCVAACAAGLLLGVRALRAEGRRAIRLHAASFALLAASLLLAETMLPAIGLSLLVYRSCTSWRRAAVRWSVDLALVGAGMIHYALDAPVRLAAASGSEGPLQHARVIGDQFVTLFTSTLAPWAPGRTAVLVALLAGAALVALRVVRARRAGAGAGEGEGEREREMWRWLAVAGVALLAAAASYVIYVPADASYQPLAAGVGNRVNLGALVPLSILAYAIARLLGELVPWPRARVAVTIALVGVIAIPSVRAVRADRMLWTAAAEKQDAVLSGLHRALPAPPPGSSMLVLNAPGVVTRFGRIGHESVNRPVPVFSTWWELDVAVKLSYGRSDLDAYPIWAQQPPQLVCGAHDVYQLGLDGVRHALAYRHVYVVDARRARATRLDGPIQCERVTNASSTTRYDLPV